MFLLRMRGSRNFCQGGPGLAARKQPGQHFLSLAYFTVLEGKWFYCRESYTFSRIQRGPTFSKRWGSNFFQWGCPNANFYRNSYNLWYSRGCCWSGSPTPSGSAHDKLSVYKFTNSVRSTIKLKAVLHEILNVKIKVWKSHVDLDVQFTFVIFREE